MSRRQNRAERNLKQRQDDFDAMRTTQGRKRPGSTNAHKNSRGKKGKR